MVERRRAFSGLARRAEPFDWPRFFKTAWLQPVPIWLALGLLSRPFGAAFPVLARASCEGRPRQALAQLASVAYLYLFPPLAAAALYLLAARRRLASVQHRRVGDMSLALLLVVCAWTTVALFRPPNRRWSEMRPAFSALRAACWP